MTSTFFTRMFGFSYRAINLNIDDISDEESLIVPQPAGNCMNWILGHIILSRNSMLKSLGQEELRIQTKFEHYERGAASETDSQNLTSFEQLKNDFRSINERFLSVLNDIPLEKFNQVSHTNKTLADDLAFLYFHEAYHAGQIGLIRRLLGRKGAIR